MMNHNEIEACVIKAKNGSKEELLKVIEQFKPFIIKTAREFNIRDMDKDDLFQIGSAALVNAVIKYKIGSHTFSSYAFSAVKNEFRYAARKASKSSKDLSINTPIREIEESSIEISDCLEAPVDVEETVMKKETYKELRQALNKLSKEDREILLMIYCKGITLKTYAEENKLSYIQAARKKKRALEKLRIYMGKKV
jgi:RNA polymerase sigma factor (sigma-70 family)